MTLSLLEGYFRLQAFSNGIFRTFLDKLTRFRLMKRFARSLCAIAEFLVTDRFCRGGSVIASVHLSVRFHSSFEPTDHCMCVGHYHGSQGLKLKVTGQSQDAVVHLYCRRSEAPQLSPYNKAWSPLSCASYCGLLPACQAGEPQ